MTRGNPDSIALFHAARNGSERAREELFARLEPHLRELVRRRMGQRLRARAESVDVTQSVLADALAGFERFRPDGDGALLRWLARIAENKLCKEARRMRYGDRDPFRARPVQPGDSQDAGFEPPARGTSGDSPSVLAVGAEQRRRVLELVERLPERERTLVRLRQLEQLEWSEVLERSGETHLKAARGVLARGMARLASWAADLK